MKKQVIFILLALFAFLGTHANSRDTWNIGVAWDNTDNFIGSFEQTFTAPTCGSLEDIICRIRGIQEGDVTLRLQVFDKNGLRYEKNMDRHFETNHSFPVQFTIEQNVEVTQGEDYTIKIIGYDGILVEYATTANGELVYNASGSKMEVNFSQARNVDVSQQTATTQHITWTRGYGEKCHVFMIEGDFDHLENITPPDGSSYRADTRMGFGDYFIYNGRRWYCVYNGVGTSVDVTNLKGDTRYTIRVVESKCNYYNNDSFASNPISDVTAEYTTPTIQACNIDVTSWGLDYFRATWINGNGTDRVVFVHEGPSGDFTPIDGETYYPNTSFGKTAAWHCVYNSRFSGGSSVTVSNLKPGRTYRIRVFEYNGDGGQEKYLKIAAAINPRNMQTKDITIPSIQAYNINPYNIQQNSAVINWANGNGYKRVVFYKQGIHTSDSPDLKDNVIYEIGDVTRDGWKCAYNGGGKPIKSEKADVATPEEIIKPRPNTCLIPNLSAASNYTVMVCEYNQYLGSTPTTRIRYNRSHAHNNPVFFSTLHEEPDVQARSLNFSNITANQISVSWENGSGYQRALFVKQTDYAYASPILEDGNSYGNMPFSTPFDEAIQVGPSGFYCVYSGPDNHTTVRGLTPNTSYRFMVCEYNPGFIYNNSLAYMNPYNQMTSLVKTTNKTSTNELPSDMLVKVYPNPATNNIYIESNNQSEGTTCSIYDLTGKEIHTQQLHDSKTKIDVSGFPNGQYIVRIVNNDNVKTQKFIVQ
jgi:hypothetical protein